VSEQREIIIVNGMSCGHCKEAVEKAVKALNGVKEAVVNLDAKNVCVVYDSTSVSRVDIEKAIVDAGYEIG